MNSLFMFSIFQPLLNYQFNVFYFKCNENHVLLNTYPDTYGLDCSKIELIEDHLKMYSCFSQVFEDSSFNYLGDVHFLPQ